MKRNRRYLDQLLGSRLQIDPQVSPAFAALLCEAETSGGLLFGVRQERAGDVAAAFAASGETCAEIGEVIADPVIRVLP